MTNIEILNNYFTERTALELIESETLDDDRVAVREEIEALTENTIEEITHGRN